MAKSHYIGKKALPTLEEMTAELLAWAAYASKDRSAYQRNLRWYHTYNADCQTLADKHNLTLHDVCQVVAAISPGKDWEINIRDAEYIIESFRLGLQSETERFTYLGDRSYQTGYTWENTRKAYAYLDDGIELSPKAKKTFAFANNLEFPDAGHYVTIDQHMAHVLGKTGKRGPVNCNAVYDQMVEAVRLTADMLGMLPEHLQSLVWGTRVDAFKAGHDVQSILELVSSHIELGKGE